MRLLVLGVSHHTAPIELRERLAIPAGELPAALARLAADGALGEAVLLSTCNRSEVYVTSRSLEECHEALVAFLALISATTGFCVGCEVYRLTARLRGISPRRHDRIDPIDLNGLRGGGAYVEFTHPLCADCREWEQRLAAESEPLLTLDVREHPELARKYGIAVVPTVFRVGSDGAVLKRLAP